MPAKRARLLWGREWKEACPRLSESRDGSALLRPYAFFMLASSSRFLYLGARYRLKLLAYINAGKTTEAAKKSIPLFVLPVDTSCGLLSILTASRFYKL